MEVSDVRWVGWGGSWQNDKTYAQYSYSLDHQWLHAVECLLFGSGDEREMAPEELGLG